MLMSAWNENAPHSACNFKNDSSANRAESSVTRGTTVCPDPVMMMMMAVVLSGMRARCPAGGCAPTPPSHGPVSLPNTSLVVGPVSSYGACHTSAILIVRVWNDLLISVVGVLDRRAKDMCVCRPGRQTGRNADAGQTPWPRAPRQLDNAMPHAAMEITAGWSSRAGYMRGFYFYYFGY